MKVFIFTLLFSLFAVVGFSQTAPKSYVKATTVQVFPNPTTSFFRIDDINEQVATIYLYNLIGKRMKAFDASNNSDFFVNDLSNGLYLVQLLDEHGQIVGTTRLTKR